MRIKDARQSFVGIWIRKITESEPFEVWGGSQLRDFNFVDDVVDAFLMAAADEKSNGCIFNLGGDEVVSLLKLAEMLVEIENGGKFRIREFPEDRKQIDIGDYYSDHNLISEVLGWQPRTSLRDGFSTTLAYYQKHGRAYL